MSPNSPHRDYTSSTSHSSAPSGQNRLKRPQSMEIVEDDESVLSSLDDVARSLSKSVELLERKQNSAESSRSSAFRKAVEGAGIMQLPKQPSSTALNAALSQTTPSDPSLPPPPPWLLDPDVPLTPPNPVHPQERVPSGRGYDWYETNLGALNYPVPGPRDPEAHALSVDLSSTARNTNNNSRVRDGSYRLAVRSRPISPDDAVDKRRGLVHHNPHSENVSNRMTVKRYNEYSRCATSSPLHSIKKPLNVGVKQEHFMYHPSHRHEYKNHSPFSHQVAPGPRACAIFGGPPLAYTTASPRSPPSRLFFFSLSPFSKLRSVFA